MKVDYTELFDEVEIESAPSINTFGGEDWVDDYEFREYGIQIGELTISEISPEEMKKLGVAIIDHLMANGHEFEFYNDNQGNGRMFKDS